MGLYVKQNNQLVVIANNSTSTINPFVGATSTENGQAGVVPAPSTTDIDKFLCGNGTWASVVNTSKATETSDGLMSKEDKIRLDDMPMIITSSTEPSDSEIGDLWLKTY